ncbi:hypothetical protein Hanom_Chr06g00554681 [Helianthus anomalus]
MAEIVLVDDDEANVEDAETKADADVERESEAKEDKVDQTTEAEEKKLKSDYEKEAEEKDAKYKRLEAQIAALMANLDKPKEEVSNYASSVCLRCRELQGEVHRLSTENQSLVNEMSNFKESNFFVKRNESMYVKKIKGYETEIDVLTCILNEKLQIIDLAHDTMSEKIKEVSKKCKELFEAQLKIVELEKKLSQFRDSTFFMKHMMGGLKKSNDKTSVGFKGFNEVPPPLSHDCSFLPDEDELIDFLSTSPSSSTSSQGDVSESDDAKKENNREPVLQRKNSHPKNKNQTFVKKVTFVQGSDMKNETVVIEK